MTPADRYTRLAITLHWLMAVLIIGNIVLIKIVDQLPEERIRLAIDTHKSVGITVLGLFVLRALWRLAHRPPQLPQDMPAWERRGAHLAHLVLYGLLFALPFSGWLHDSAWRAAAEHPMHLFGGVEWPRIAWVMEQEPAFKERLHHWFGMAHEWLADVFYVLLALHVLGALKHQFLDRKKQLQRMWY